MTAYPQKNKAFYVERMKAHMAAGELIRSTRWENGRGCAIGCTLHRYDHAAFSDELGWPSPLPEMFDWLFEHCSAHQTFPLRCLEAVLEGADLSLVYARLMLWMLTDAKWGVRNCCGDDRDTYASITAVAELFASHIAGDPPTEAEGAKVYRQAWSAAAAAVEAAVRAAEAAAWAAVMPTAAAAWAQARAAVNMAWAAWDYSGVGQQFIDALAEKFVELLAASSQGK